MKIGLEWVKQWLLEDIQALHKEKAIATQELDKIKIQIADQRNGKSQVLLEMKTLEQEIPTLMDILYSTQEILSKNTLDFHKLTENQQQTITELQKQIDRKANELQTYEEKSKQIIDIDWINKRYKEELTVKSEELKEIIATLKLTKEENDRIKEENKQFLIYKQQEEAKLQSVHKSLQERQYKIDAYRRLLEGK